MKPFVTFCYIRRDNNFLEEIKIKFYNKIIINYSVGSRDYFVYIGRFLFFSSFSISFNCT